MLTHDRIARLRIFLFGGFRVETEKDDPILLTGKRGPAILAYLARSPGMAAQREKLADLLWSDSDSGRSRNSLRQTLSVLRRDLMRAKLDVIRTRGDTVGLSAEAVDVDVEDFEAGLPGRSPQELEAALTVYSGPFLDGFHLGSDPFDGWAAAERERLSSRAVVSLEKLARVVDLDAGLVLADRLLAMDPTQEASYRLKIELLAASGQRDRAMRTYEACKAMLRKEFGVDVSPETRTSGNPCSPLRKPVRTQIICSRRQVKRSGRDPFGRRSAWQSSSTSRASVATTISRGGWFRTSPPPFPSEASTLCTPVIRLWRKALPPVMPKVPSGDALCPERQRPDGRATR